MICKYTVLNLIIFQYFYASSLWKTLIWRLRLLSLGEMYSKKMIVSEMEIRRELFPCTAEFSFAVHSTCTCSNRDMHLNIKRWKLFWNFIVSCVIYFVDWNSKKTYNTAIQNFSNSIWIELISLQKSRRLEQERRSWKIHCEVWPSQKFGTFRQLPGNVISFKLPNYS